MKPTVLSICSLFSTETRHQTKTFLHILDNDQMKRFGSDQSSMMNENKTQECVGLRPYSTLMFTPLLAPLKIAQFHYHSPLLTKEKAI